MTLLQARTIMKVLLCVVVLFVASGFAADNLVTNGSFEDTTGVTFDPCGSGCSFSRAAIPGWINSPTESGQLRPVPPDVFNETAPNNGPTSAYAAPGFTISQTVGGVTVQEGVTYTLTLEIGHRLLTNFGGSADLLVEGVTYPAETVTPPGPGNWSTYTAEFVGSTANAGATITIQLITTGVDTQGNYDSVSLTSSAGPPIPEPSSMLLFGSGVLGLAQVLRRKLM